MNEGPRWEDLFGEQETSDDASGGRDNVARPSRAPSVLDEAARSREEQRLLEEVQLLKTGDAASTRQRRRRGWALVLVLVSMLAIPAVVAGSVWFTFEDQVRRVMGWEPPNDFEGEGFGEATVVIAQGEIGADVARTLAEEGVTKTFDAFYDLLLAQSPPVSFVPGTFVLRKEMSAQAALAALLDGDNKVITRVTIPEGITANGALERVSDALDVPLDELEAITSDYEALGVPAEAPSIEGYLFPATYELAPDITPEQLIQTMVDRMIEALDSAGVDESDRHEVVTMASLIQREARITDDFYKVSRVILNRFDERMPLQFDSTSHYGAQSQGSVWTTDRERADDNPYNTYVHRGLPIGPIALPGEIAIDAAMNPTRGKWLYFVAVNLETGESAFSNTLAEHGRATRELREWCQESDENAAYCQ